MWSAGLGEAMSSTAGRVIQVILVLLALAESATSPVHGFCVAMTTPITMVTVVGASLAARGATRC